MLRRNIKLSIVFLFLIGISFSLAGCGGKETQKTGEENKNMEQNQVQNQAVQGVNGERSDRGAGKFSAEAETVCNGKAIGDSCEVAMPARNNEENEVKKISGVCTQMQNSEIVACKSADMPKGGPGKGGSQAQTGANAVE
ncbi:MAG: hypothetical protein UR66_C0001G0054 [Candidatus Moranbacteria bacterium GW2011_GWE1_35_17]|nr:MAG: hypothetical protein UR66_C0001G0054 [Candidatus Moranbacteria bacterium GW2011_GWE1_35_17]KKP73484.1 MAG: hypothetical protein UR65_C0003G0008 [Candidatus Moranbacteria bacterium GW2011_GWE2_35_164]KKP83399.1 MAG: hypothetical protein UR82_C0021G0029 [Candidatus Moranbacteria bacterium GW2011_GWF1_35_5]KKP85228.1 MAG: hypothetical protein UR83_C0003G0063 [Candidatus Moranbacteria bacterium GW2011_GWF2_35_54]